jgi:hypothetical protein
VQRSLSELLRSDIIEALTGQLHEFGQVFLALFDSRGIADQENFALPALPQGFDFLPFCSRDPGGLMLNFQRRAEITA